MAEIAYGSGDQPGFPPVALPSLGVPRPRITITAPPQADQGPWAPYAAPAPAQPAAAQGAMPWAPYAPPAPSPAGRNVDTFEATGRGALDALSFGAYPALAGVAAASGIQPSLSADTEPVTAGDVTGSTNPVGDAVYLAKLAGMLPVGAARLVDNALSSHPDQAISDAYTQTREQTLEQQRRAQEQHPLGYLTGQLGGSVLPAFAVPGLGLGGATTLGRIGSSARAGAVGGGLYGSGEALSEGGSPIDVAKGAAGGALAGTALGGILGSTIEGVTGAGSKIASIVRGSRDADAEAARKILSALQSDAPQVNRTIGDTAALTAGSEAGTPMALVDYGGENARALLRSAANTSPTARNIIVEDLHNRYRQQADRFSNWIRAKFGGDKDADIEALKARARAQNAPKYRAAYRAGEQGVWSPELERLASSRAVLDAAQDAARQGSNRAVADKMGAFNPHLTFENGLLKIQKGKGVPTFPDLQYWDYTQRSLRDAATKLRNSGAADEAGSLFKLHRDLIDELDRLVPKFKEARGSAAGFFKAQDALEAGANFVTDGTIHDATAARMVAKMKPAEQELFQRGFATELAHQIERSGYRSDVLNSLFVASPRATRRIEIALGKDGAGEFEALMRIEGIINRARQALGNSTTVRQSHEAGLAGAGAVGIFEGLHGAFNPVYLIAGALILGGRAAAKHVDDSVAIKVAEMLMSHDPSVLQRGAKIASKSPALRDALRRASDIGARQLINYMRPSGVGAAALTGMRHLPGLGEAPPHEATHGQDDYQDQNQPGQP